jgi:hypothetical protein
MQCVYILWGHLDANNFLCISRVVNKYGHLVSRSEGARRSLQFTPYELMTCGKNFDTNS